MYSHFCAELASEGCVVLAIEHRDGTGPSVRIRSNGTFRTLHYSPLSEIVCVYFYANKIELLLTIMECRWEDGIPDHFLPLRSEQLVFRSAEVYETFRTFSELVRGISKNLVCETGGSTYDFLQWIDTVDIDRLTLTGHSFGASTVVCAHSSFFILITCAAIETHNKE